MLILIAILAFVIWVFFSSSKESSNTLVVEKSTGRVVALTFINWDGNLEDRINSIMCVEQDYSPDVFELVEFNESTIGQYDLHLYNRD